VFVRTADLEKVYAAEEKVLATGAAVSQLGPFGTAAKKLKEWDLNFDGRRVQIDTIKTLANRFIKTRASC
jgi:hypothetical protein